MVESFPLICSGWILVGLGLGSNPDRPLGVDLAKEVTVWCNSNISW